MGTNNKTTKTKSAVLQNIEPTKIDLDNTTSGSVKIKNDALINVKSNVFGELFYIDPVTKEETRWPQCGAVQTLSMESLRNMKRGAIKFFTNQLIVITGFADENADKYQTADIYKDLYITQYYKDFLDPANIEEICSMTPEKIKERVPLLSNAAKMELVVALNTYIEEGVLDSLKSIRAFEEVLGCELKIPE